MKHSLLQPETKAVNNDQLLNVALVTGIEQQLQELAHTYGISPVFVGLFGSRAKGYAGPDSDFDYYVPYVGKISQYVRALNLDTSQVEEEEILPRQKTITVVGAFGKEYKVQLNLVSLDHFMQQLTQSNIDFRMALDNILLQYCDSSFIQLLTELAISYFDLTKVKHISIGRAIKTMQQLKHKEGISLSEITDGVYRLFYAAGTTNARLASFFYYNHTHTLTELLAGYLNEDGSNPRIKYTMDGIMRDIVQGGWKQSHIFWHSAIIAMINDVGAFIDNRPVCLQSSRFIDKSIQARMALAARANKAFIGLLLKAHSQKELPTSLAKIFL